MLKRSVAVTKGYLVQSISSYRTAKILFFSLHHILRVEYCHSDAASPAYASLVYSSLLSGILGYRHLTFPEAFSLVCYLHTSMLPRLLEVLCLEAMIF